MRKIYYLSIFLFIFLAWTGSALAQEQINNYQVDLNLRENSVLEVSETIDYDFGSDKRHGIYRQIPIYYSGEDQNYTVAVENLRVSDENGQAYKFTTDQLGAYLMVKIGDANKYVSGQKTYVIDYQVRGAILFFDDYDELYWNAVGNNWEVPVNQAGASLVLPAAVPESQSVFRCWSGRYQNQDNCQNLILDKNTSGEISGFSASQFNLSPNQALTILAQLPKGVIDQAAAEAIAPEAYDPNKNYPPGGIVFEDTFTRERLIGQWWYLFLPLLTFVAMYRLWQSRGRDPKGRGNIIVQYDVPDDLRPAEVGAIVYEKVDNNYLTAEIIYLATHGYLKITRKPKSGWFGQDDFELTKIKEADAGLKDYQKDLLGFLFEKKSKIKTSDLKDSFYKHVSGWKKDVWELLKQEKYYRNVGQTDKTLLFILGVALIAIGPPLAILMGIFGTFAFIISGIIVMVFARLMPQKSQEGVLKQEYLLGLKEYLEVAEKDRLEFHNAPEKDPQTFEKLLPYAIVFGVEDKWAEKFKDIYRDPPQWYSDPSMRGFNAALLVSSLHSFESVSAKNLATPTKSGSGGYGGGGGFSGGGFGGGGGGSW